MIWSLIWIIPIFSATVWLAMLLAMLIWWLVQGSPHFASMEPSQRIAYISDVGAQDLKPLFIAMSAVTVVTFDLVFISERWLRHKGKLAQNTSWIQKTFSILATLAAIAGAAGLILLSIFDTLHHPKLHDAFLGVFIGGYVISAVFICLEYWRLERHNRDRVVLRVSFYIKLAFIIIEVGLAIAFGATQKYSKWNDAAVLEWVIALIYTFYVLSFLVDFLPTARTDHQVSRETNLEMATAAGANGYSNGNGYAHNTNQSDADRYYGNGRANGYVSPYANGLGPGSKPTPPAGTARNF